MSLNNNYTFPIMVSITSILINSKVSTFIHFHLLIDEEFKKRNMFKIISLKKLNKNSDFLFYNVRKRFLGWKINRNLPITTYYRILIPDLVKNVDKIIYLDGDTLTYGDLNELYSLNINNLYFKGFREYVKNGSIPYVNTDRYICAGVMLMNLKLLRKSNAFEKFKKYYYFLYSKKQSYNDQNIINTIFIKKIGFLPPKFGIFQIDKFLNKYKERIPKVYNISELIEANRNPIIRHIWGKLKNKPWLIKDYDEIKQQWNYYAKKTGYYIEICRYFKNACININKK